MSKLSTKIASVGISVVTAVSLSGIAPVAFAQSTADLQAMINSLLAQIQSLQAQLSAQTGGGSMMTSCYNFTQNLTLEAKGAEVTELHKVLIASGHLKIAAPTGYFGPMTKAALAAWQADNGVSPAVGYFGPITRAAMAAKCVPGSGGGSGGSGGGVVPSGFSLSLAADNPIAQSVPKGATGVTFLKFNVSGTGTLSSLTFKRMGIGSTSDFGSAGIYLYDGATRLTNGRSINSTTHEVTFLNLNLAVNGVKTLSLVADVASAATTGNRNYFTLVSAMGTPNPTGTLMGNEMAIAGQAVGGVEVAIGSTPSNPKVGQQGVKIGEFKLTASSTEDIHVQRVAITEGGSIANENLSNFMLKQGGNVVATAAAIGGKDLIVFSFTTPFLLEKGQQRTFEVYADIAGQTRSADTIGLYIDSASDVYAVGKTYGYPVLPNFASFNTVPTSSSNGLLTVQGGELTITFNGPVTGDITLRQQDALLYDFTIASQNNVEIRNLRFNVSTTGATAIYNDFKVWDAASNAVITSATNVSGASTNVTFTDVINLSAGTSKRFKVTADVDSTNSANGTVRVHLLAFQSNDVRNLDNNTYVATSVIVPNSTVSGNTMTVKSLSLDTQLSATPTSQTYVKGKNDVALAGFSFRAVSGKVRIDTIKVTGTASSGTLSSAEVQSLALYDGATRISDFKSLDTTNLDATFSNLNYSIDSGVTKVLTLRGNISANAGVDDIYYFYIAAVSSANISAYDVDGNAVSLTGTAANSGGTVAVTVANVGDVTVAQAPSDTESEAGIVIMGRENVLAKFRFTATNEDMTVNKMQLLVVPTNSATATSGNAADEVPVVKLYDTNGAQVGNAGGYTVQASGDNAGVVVIESLGWSIPKDNSKTLVVKGVLNSNAGGADSGASIYVSVMAAGFEAQGASALDTSITAATGFQKVAYKTKPTITVAAGGEKLAEATAIKVIKVTIAADSAEQVSWKKIQLAVSTGAASLTAVTANPGTTGNVQIIPVGGSALNIATAFSGSTASASTTSAIAGNSSGFVTLILNQEEVIGAGQSKTYDIKLTFQNLCTTTTGCASASVKLHQAESTLVAATTYANAELSAGGATTDGTPSFIWSDNSAVGHSESTADWANSVLIKTLPSDQFSITN